MSTASTYGELEEMLKTFRCQDLISLLQFFGQSRNGKKTDQLDRCIGLLKKGNPAVHLKIKEIFKYTFSF
jgi:hypothetical protein